MSWYKKLIPSKIRTSGAASRKIPEGLWNKCPACEAVLYRPELRQSLEVCPRCDHHLRLSARRRLDVFLDEGGREEIGADLESTDFLRFKDSRRYRDRLSEARRKSGESEALVVVKGRLAGAPLVVAAFEFAFIGGSMGSVVGERFRLGVERCIADGVPLVCFSASGGARMQEALVSLLQMSKTASALAHLARARLPYVSVLTDPTMGGVSASLATLGDVIVAEPGALIGFAGPRVIKQTVREELPEGFQSSEFLLEHGAIDAIVPRLEMRARVANVLALLMQARH